MPKVDRAIGTFGKPKLVKKIITTCLVVTGLGGATLVSQPVHRDTAVAIDQQPAGGDAVVSRTPVVTVPRPVVVTKESSAQDIVKAIVSQGQAARLSEDQIKTIIATA